jgi:hypothetical protein
MRAGAAGRTAGEPDTRGCLNVKSTGTSVARPSQSGKDPPAASAEPGAGSGRSGAAYAGRAASAALVAERIESGAPAPSISVTSRRSW